MRNLQRQSKSAGCLSLSLGQKWNRLKVEAKALTKKIRIVYERMMNSSTKVNQCHQPLRQRLPSQNCRILLRLKKRENRNEFSFRSHYILRFQTDYLCQISYLFHRAKLNRLRKWGQIHCYRRKSLGFKLNLNT